MDKILGNLKSAVILGEAEEAKMLAAELLSKGQSPLNIFQNALIPAMDTVGKKMQEQEYYLPEVIMSAEAMKSAYEVLKPAITSGGALTYVGRVILGTVQGDLHDIGKNLVGVMLEGAGFEIVDLGVDVPTNRFVAEVQKVEPDIVGLSALLSVTMARMQSVVEALTNSGLRKSVKVIVGGAPVTQSFADEIGADGYAEDAAGAKDLALRLVSLKRKN